ncbi:MAG TPA: hypothetical protein PL181_07990 [bacterium]|nr:hypothetical protein [bacterium]
MFKIRDITITGAAIMREIRYSVISLGIALLANGYAIVKYQAGWGELITQLPFVLALALVLYLIAAALRLLFHSLRWIAAAAWRKK